MERYRVLAHTADTAIESDAATLDLLVENLAYGMFDLMFDLEDIESGRLVTIELQAPTIPDLLVDILADLLYEAESADLVFASFSAHVDEGNLSARILASGSSVTSVELRGPPIKAVTYHDLAVSLRDGGWYGRVVFDV
jgi:SHS2 domain-containing protein